MNKTLNTRKNIEDKRTRKDLQYSIEKLGKNWATKWAQVAKRKSRNGSKYWKKSQVQHTENFT